MYPDNRGCATVCVCVCVVCVYVWCVCMCGVCMCVYGWAIVLVCCLFILYIVKLKLQNVQLTCCTCAKNSDVETVKYFVKKKLQRLDRH